MGDGTPFGPFNPSLVQIETVRVPDDQSILPVFLLGEPHSLIAHWKGKNGQPCLGEDCPAARHLLKQQWKNYAPGYYQHRKTRKWIKAVIEITAIMWDDIRPHRPLRGTVWQCARWIDGEKNGENRARLIQRLAGDELDDDFDVRPHVKAMYGGQPIIWDVPNPHIGRVYATPLDMPQIVVPEYVEPQTTMTPEEQAEVKRLWDEMMKKNKQKRTGGS